MTIQEKIIDNAIAGTDFLNELYSNTDKYDPNKNVILTDLPFINTIYFSEALCKRYDLNSKDKKTFQPELGLMLIKKILYDSLDFKLLTPEFLVSIFNKNQELIEMPYIYALYLGGLHYFNTNENIRLIRDFTSTNNILIKDKNNNIYDIYADSKMVTRDSYYKSKEKTIEFNNDEKNDKGEDSEVVIQNLSTLNGLACGYGIQHNFLNKYYELLFNKPINKPIDKEKEKNHLYAMIGGYNGIIKPLKINSGGYNVNDSIDFIGLYRNVCVDERAFANIDDKEIINDVKNKQFFLAYSKLKAKYLSGLYDDSKFNTICKELDKYSFSKTLFTKIFNQNIIQQNFFGSNINKILDKADNNTTKMISVLKEMWTLEKNNMLSQYSKISKSTYCLIPSAGGVINFDLKTLNSKESDINYEFLCNLQKILWFEDSLNVNNLIKKNNSSLPYYFFQLNTFTDSMEEINIKNNNSLYYFNTLLDSLDIEKLEYFTNLFTDFCDMKQKNNDNDNDNDNGYTLRSLLLGITTIGYEDISDTKIPTFHSTLNDPNYNTLINTSLKTLTFKKDEINALLIGNSVYTYDSFYDYDISMVLNIALTQAQYNNYQKIRKDFLNNKITIANLSTIGPLKYNNSPELSLHKIITLPEIMFSNANNYEEVIANINKINKNNDKESNLFLTRRLLFNNQFVEEFSVLKDSEKIELYELNNIYMIHPTFLKYDYVANIVIKFFETLNIKYSKNNYLLLLRLIRGFYYYIVKTKEMEMIKLNNKMSDNEIYLNFFKELNKTLVDSSLKGINDILSNVSDTFNTFTQNSTNDLYDKENKEKSIHSLKKGTYYNLKNMYEKLSNTHDESLDNDGNSTNIAISEISDFSQLDITVLNNKLTCNNLFSGFNKANDEGYDLYQIFNIIDRGNNDIGSKVLCDLNFLYENIYCNFNAESVNEQQSKPLGNLTEAAVYMLFSELATRSGFLFQQIPNYLNLNSRVTTNDDDLNTITDEMFGTHLDTELFGKSLLNKENKSFGGITGLPGFIFQLGAVTTELNEDEYSIEKNVNNYNNSFQLDVGFNENKEIVCKTKNAPDDILKSNVTCFTVDFGGQKQQMFFNINLDTSQFFNTEEGIKTWVNLISKNQQTAVTTNIFPILETRSYTCTISSLGNATIQPLTYFYLRNVPLFNGTYWITNVTHDISPNTMITTFQGVRQPIASKSDSRQPLLNLMEKRSLELQKITNNIKTIKTTDMVESVGEIYKISDVDILYGIVYQKRSDLLGYVEFNGKVLIGIYINMISGNNDTNIINKMVISYLYNRAKSICKTTDHKTIINTMIDIVIYDLKNLANRSDIRLVLNEKSKDLSLYQVYKTSESKFSEQSELSELLTKIGENVGNYKCEITNTDLKRYNLQAKDSGDKPIQKNSEVIKISIPDNSSTLSEIPLSSITQILLHDIHFYGDTKFMGIDGGKNITLFNLFNEIGVKGKGVITKTNTVNFNGVNVSYLGSFRNEDVSISCFSSSYEQTNEDIKKQKLDLKTFNELINNSVIVPTYPKPSSKQIEQNRVLVMKEFKRIYKNDAIVKLFIKEFIAGIMGNIQMESGFNVNAVNKDDKKVTKKNEKTGKYEVVSYPSIGLFQFQSTSYGNNETNVEKFFEIIGGRTVDGQINFLTKNTEGEYKHSNYKEFIQSVSKIKIKDYSDKNKLVEHLTYLFASKFERCEGCKDIKSDTIKERKKVALGFYEDMKKENSYLYYDNK